MSRPTRMNPEGFTSRPTETAWGCVAPSGWVPFPPQIPRRHPLLDAVGGMDDPCDRPSHKPPDYEPTPSFKPPREGYPNNMCNIEESRSQSGGAYDSQIPEGAAVINVGKDTQHAIRVKIPAIVNNATGGEDPTIQECCDGSRSLDVLKEKYEEIVGPLEEREAGHEGQFTKCMSICQPLLPKYPCRGVIDEKAEEWPQVAPEDRCRARSLQGGVDPGSWESKKNLSGWEFVEKCRTCDYYPIDSNLPKRFNNPDWFKGYGCERPAHPFYVTTSADYGRFGPNPHTMTQMYHPKNNEFTNLLGITGMYRNRTLNTSNNKTYV